jgi:hypothetical protein
MCYTRCMTNDAATGPPRISKTTSVRLDDLHEQVLAAAMASGVGPSTWLRDLARRELSAGVSSSPSAEAVDSEASAAVYRAWLSADLTAQLDLRRKRDGFRSRAAVLRALISGVGITAGGDVAAPRDEAAAGPLGRPATLRDAVDVLGASNHQLVAIARNVSVIAKALRDGDGAGRVIDRIRLEESVTAVRTHIQVASVLLGVLRPLLKSSGNK